MKIGRTDRSKNVVDQFNRPGDLCRYVIMKACDSEVTFDFSGYLRNILAQCWFFRLPASLLILYSFSCAIYAIHFIDLNLM